MFGFKRRAQKNSQVISRNYLIDALNNYINEYEIDNGRKPEGMLIDHIISMTCIRAGINLDKMFGITFIPADNIKGGLIWKAQG